MEPALWESRFIEAGNLQSGWHNFKSGSCFQRAPKAKTLIDKREKDETLFTPAHIMSTNDNLAQGAGGDAVPEQPMAAEGAAVLADDAAASHLPAGVMAADAQAPDTPGDLEDDFPAPSEDESLASYSSSSHVHQSIYDPTVGPHRWVLYSHGFVSRTRV